MIQKDDIFNLESPQQAPEQGGVIIAEPFLPDVHFRRTCVCLTSYAGNAPTTGLILNNRLPLCLNDVLPGEITAEEEIPLFYGGPVSVDHLLFIHSLGEIIPNSFKVCDNIYFNGDFSAIAEYANSGNKVEGKVKFFLGYSGWETGQLSDELKMHTWAVCNTVQRASYLSLDTEDYWRSCVRQMGLSYRNWLVCPTNPLAN